MPEFLRIDGPGAWLASRAAGLTAYLALTLEIALGLFLSTGVADAWMARARSMELHRWLSRGSLALVAAHASALLLDRAVRFDLVDMLVPFVSGYRPFAVGLGVLGAWLAWGVHVSFSLRDRLGQRLWRALHYSSFGVYALATAHGLLAGSDGGRAGVGALYLGSAALVGALLVARGVISRPCAPRSRAAP